MKMLSATRLSALDLAPITEGGSAGQALRNSLELAQQLDNLDFTRFWLAEHHNLIDVACAATPLVIGYLAANTRRIRVGSGGIMLPNHSPLVIAEQFGTLETLYPGRIDLGLGRAPGTDQDTLRALRRQPSDGSEFPQLVEELQHFLAVPSPGQSVRAIPGAGLEIPLWLLGSSLFSAQLAAQQGLPFAYAAHFAPDHLPQALQLYREQFTPSSALAEPYVLVCVNAVAAPTASEARFLASTEQQKFLGLIRGKRSLLPPPVENMDALWSPAEAHHVRRMLRESIVGDREQVREALQGLVQRTQADEIMINSWIFDQQARLRSYRIIAEAWKG